MYVLSSIVFGLVSGCGPSMVDSPEDALKASPGLWQQLVAEGEEVDDRHVWLIRADGSCAGAKEHDGHFQRGVGWYPRSRMHKPEVRTKVETSPEGEPLYGLVCGFEYSMYGSTDTREVFEGTFTAPGRLRHDTDRRDNVLLERMGEVDEDGPWHAQEQALLADLVGSYYHPNGYTLTVSEDHLKFDVKTRYWHSQLDADLYLMSIQQKKNKTLYSFWYEKTDGEKTSGIVLELADTTMNFHYSSEIQGELKTIKWQRASSATEVPSSVEPAPETTSEPSAEDVTAEAKDVTAEAKEDPPSVTELSPSGSAGLPGGSVAGGTMDSASLSASSTLASTSKYSYQPANAADLNPSTAWVEGEDDGGVGQSLSFSSADGDCRGLVILNGYQKNADAFTNNARVRSFEVSVDGQHAANLNLEDRTGEQHFELAIASGKKVTLEITGVYPGAKWQDTAITELWQVCP